MELPAAHGLYTVEHRRRVRVSEIKGNVMSKNQASQGEGHRTAAQQYNRATTAYAVSGKVRPAADAAKKAVNGPDRADLERAEAEGLKPAKVATDNPAGSKAKR